jgi:hypothetical protein
MNEKTHYKKLYNPNYLGAYALQPGQEMTLTIASAKVEGVVGEDGKKEDCAILNFTERGVKPMILNITNAKTIEKIYNTPFVEDWVGKQIRIYAKKVKAFGEVVDALRIKPIVPRNEPELPDVCEVCGKKLEKFGTMEPPQLAKYTKQKYGQVLCADHAQEKADDAAGAKEAQADAKS